VNSAEKIPVPAGARETFYKPRQCRFRHLIEKESGTTDSAGFCPLRNLKMRRREITAAALIFLFGATTAYLSTRMTIGDFRAAGSGLFPLCLGILLMLLSSLHILQVHLKSGKQGDVKKPSPASEEGSRTTGQVILFMGAIAAATLLFSRLGYPAVSFLLLLALLRILFVKKRGAGNWGLSLFLAFATASASYFLFVKLLKIPLPRGWIGL
jgi:hypothetical protein